MALKNIRILFGKLFISHIISIWAQPTLELHIFQLLFLFIMISQPIRKTFDLGDGREVSIETDRLARQADGSVTVTMGKSIILATLIANKEAKQLPV